VTRSRAQPTLAQLFVGTTFALALVVGATFYAFLESSRRSIVLSSDRSRDAEAVRLGGRLSAELGVASEALLDVETALHFGAMSVSDAAAVETRLFSELLAHPELSDISLTHGALPGLASAHASSAELSDRWQLSVFRTSADARAPIFTRRTSFQGGRFVADVRARPPGGALFSAPFVPEGPASDPTTHLTFETPVSPGVYGRAIWSDLSFSELDAALPQDQRRVVVTKQKAVEEAPGKFAGVVRVGLSTRQIDELPRKYTTADERVILCDSAGRLLARLDPRDRVELLGDDLRIHAEHVPPDVAAALASPRLRALSDAAPERADRLDVGGAPYLVTFRALADSQGWVVAILVPEDYYTRDLLALRRRFFLAILLVTAVVLLAGLLVLFRLRASLGRVVAATQRMRSFDFSPGPTDAPLREMAEVMEGVERAKTSMRALGKYVPIDLVRELFEANREPELGGDLVEISLMFSDIEGFTTLSERLSPDALAEALGHYLQAMTRAIRSTGGTVDKFIGDAVMAFWNAPTPHPDHARRACRAALLCGEATRVLYASPAWTGLPPLVTRFGLHRATVMVGHFGAPERLSYTALGDGVNLASRLEGLCKQYGIELLASEAIMDHAGDEYAFRLIDRVAVKGRAESVRVYELLGDKSVPVEALARARIYEQGLEAYFARDFARALTLLATCPGDPASRILSARCSALLAKPPPEDWNGVYVATSK
jgi:adenylate cyclase